jgi:hypothetical protein
MLRKKTFREVGGLAITITFVAAVAVLAIIWHLPQPTALDSVPDVLSMEAKMNMQHSRFRMAQSPILNAKEWLSRMLI